MTLVTCDPFLYVKRSKVKVIGHKSKQLQFRNEAHSWWRHLTNKFANVGVKSKILHKFAAQIRVRVFPLNSKI